MAGPGAVDRAEELEDLLADPKYFRLWRHVTDALGPRDRLSNGRPKPEAVYREAEGALVTLAGQWKQRFDAIRAGSVGDVPLPPVMIVVCDTTEVAEVFFQRISGERVVERPSDDGRARCGPRSTRTAR